MKKLLEWIKGLFGKKKPPTPAPTPVPAPVPAPTFVADFTSGKIDPAVWRVSTWTAPGNNDSNTGRFSAEHAFVENGVLCLALTQTKQPDGKILSLGAELATLKEFSYGTYEFVARASSTAGTPNQAGMPVSGSITGCFVYRDLAATELDVEVEGNERSSLTQFTTWVGESNPNQTTAVQPLILGAGGWMPHEGFFKYTIKWMPNKVEFYRDDVLVATHTMVVPSLPGKVMLNHWGTDNANWGGLATVNTTRYMWVKSFKYTPLS
jgi:beta-glucanase (GH16 family)